MHIAVWYEYGAMAWAGLVMGISRQHTAYILTSEHCTAISHQQTTRAQHNLGTLLQWLNIYMVDIYSSVSSCCAQVMSSSSDITS